MQEVSVGGIMSRIQRHDLGAIEVTAITDGSSVFGQEVFPYDEPAKLNAMLEAAGKTEIDTNFNVFHVQSGDESLLIDCGPRDLFGPNAGYLGDGLKERGLTHGDITAVAITHCHPDHIAGAITSDGSAAFGNARLILPQAEHDFWLGIPSETDDDMTSGSRELARALADAYEGRLELAQPGREFVEGVSFVDMAGHTPGHCGVELCSSGHRMMLLADLLIAQDLQLADPQISAAFDMDTERATECRRSVLEKLAKDGHLCSGGHFLHPIIGRVVSEGKGFRFVSA